MESLINKFINKCICFYILFKLRRVGNKGQLLKGGVMEKRFRTTGIELQQATTGSNQLTIPAQTK